MLISSGILSVGGRGVGGGDILRDTFQRDPLSVKHVGKTPVIVPWQRDIFIFFYQLMYVLATFYYIFQMSSLRGFECAQFQGRFLVPTFRPTQSQNVTREGSQQTF